MNTHRLYIIILVIAGSIFRSVSAGNINQLPFESEIAFASNQDGDFEIYIVNTDGKNVHQLTFNDAADVMPVWSPNGDYLLFTSDRSGISEVWVMRADGSNARSLTPGLPSYGGCWSPDGTKIAFSVMTHTSSQDIYVMNADGSDTINLTSDPIHINALPFWSLDGERLFFLTDREYPREVAHDVPTLDVYVMNADGTAPLKVFGAGIGITSMNLLPDGNSIVFGVWRLGPAIVRRDLSSIQEHVLLDGIKESGSYPDWSPDGTQMVYVSEGIRLVLMNTISGDQTTLFTLNDPAQQITDPDWKPH